MEPHSPRSGPAATRTPPGPSVPPLVGRTTATSAPPSHPYWFSTVIERLRSHMHQAEGETRPDGSVEGTLRSSAEEGATFPRLASSSSGLPASAFPFQGKPRAVSRIEEIDDEEEDAFPSDNSSPVPSGGGADGEGKVLTEEEVFSRSAARFGGPPTFGYHRLWNPPMQRQDSDESAVTPPRRSKTATPLAPGIEQPTLVVGSVVQGGNTDQYLSSKKRSANEEGDGELLVHRDEADDFESDLESRFEQSLRNLSGVQDPSLTLGVAGQGKDQKSRAAASAVTAGGRTGFTTVLSHWARLAVDRGVRATIQQLAQWFFSPRAPVRLLTDKPHAQLTAELALARAKPSSAPATSSLPKVGKTTTMEDHFTDQRRKARLSSLPPLDLDDLERGRIPRPSISNGRGVAATFPVPLGRKRNTAERDMVSGMSSPEAAGAYGSPQAASPQNASVAQGAGSISDRDLSFSKGRRLEVDDHVGRSAAIRHGLELDQADADLHSLAHSFSSLGVGAVETTSAPTTAPTRCHSPPAAGRKRTR